MSRDKGRKHAKRFLAEKVAQASSLHKKTRVTIQFFEKPQ